MRIRKRLQNPLPSPDLRSPLPSPGLAVAAAAAPPVAAERGAAAAGVKEGGPMVAAAAPVDGCGGGGGKGGFHSNGLAAGTTPCLHLPFPPPSGAAAAEGEEGGVPPKYSSLRYSPPEKDAPLDYGHDQEVAVPKREAEKWKEIGDDLISRHGANSIASRSLGAEPSEASSGPGHMAPLTAEWAVRRWRNQEEGEFLLMKRRSPGHRARGRSTGSVEEEVGEDVVAERDVKPTAPGMTRRRRAAVAFGTKSTMAATGTGAGASKRCDDTVAKVAGADVMPAVDAASTPEGNAGVGNVKKRRSPAVLMEGSRCSRVNGRGWRCCQQTLVGYSLCEHHLGKGRLRSVTSDVRSNGRREEEDVGDQAPGKKRRRNNVGTVKARSLSSLLHLPDHHHHHPSPTVLVAIAAPVPEPIPSRSNSSDGSSSTTPRHRCRGDHVNMQRRYA